MSRPPQRGHRRGSARTRRLAIRVLGPVEVLLDNAPGPPELRWKRPLALLLYLARSPRWTRTREHLVGLLWPDQPDAAAHHSLSQTVHVLRRHVGAGLITTAGDQVRLDPTRLNLDLTAFDRAAGAGRWDVAGALVGGEFLEGFALPRASAFEDWLHGEREFWRRAGVDALVRHAETLNDSGRTDESDAVARRAIDLNPHSEPAGRALMRSLALRGLRAEALSIHAAMVERLATDLVAAPDAATSGLARRIREGREWRPAATAVAGHTPRRPPLFGRRDALSAVSRVWAECRTTREPRTIAVIGDPGTGRSRLLEELAARAALDGATVVGARAVAADTEVEWSGLLALAAGLVDAPGAATTPPEAVGALATLVPAWAERFARGPEPTYPGRAFRDLVRAVATERPVLLVLDDAERLDRESLLALGALDREAVHLPCLVALSAAPHSGREEVDELRSRVGRDLKGVTVQLKALGREDLRELASWALPRYRAAALDRVTRRIAIDSAGLPLLAVELVTAVAAGLELGPIKGSWPSPTRTLDDTLPTDVPDAVVAAIRVGFRHVSAAAQEVLAAAAVLGSRVPAQALADATGMGAAKLAAALDELEWQRWLVAEPRGYAFVARLVAEIVARDLVTKGKRDRIRDLAASPLPPAAGARSTRMR